MILNNYKKNLTTSIALRFLNVINGLVPLISVQGVTGLVNKFALLLHKYRFIQNCRNTSGNDDKKRRLNVCCNSFNIPHSVLSRHSIPQGTREDGVQCGRSMIEMLGVLAIIAVLSVGGIAGYSKAMEKWKADRLVSEYSYLVFGLLSNVNEFQILSKNTDYNTQVGLSNYVKAASLVPETWQYVSSTRMYDSEGNPVLMFSRRNRLVIDIYLGTKLNSNGWVSGKSEGFSVALCREVMLNLTQRLSDAVQFSRFYQWSKMEDSSVYWGNATCSAGRKCLRDLTISEINNICKSCQKDNEACGINMEF